MTGEKAGVQAGHKKTASAAQRGFFADARLRARAFIDYWLLAIM
jgi:hypothetical protein